MPTEAEWEYACRANTTAAIAVGGITGEDHDLDPLLDNLAWYCVNSGGNPHPVAQKTPNPWGLYDMHGNLCEWCLDSYTDYPPFPQTDPVYNRTGSMRVCRGGSWFSQAINCRAAGRFSFPQDWRSDFIGLRLVMEIP